LVIKATTDIKANHYKNIYPFISIFYSFSVNFSAIILKPKELTILA